MVQRGAKEVQVVARLQPAHSRRACGRGELGADALATRPVRLSCGTLAFPVAAAPAPFGTVGLRDEPVCDMAKPLYAAEDCGRLVM